jgi:hypothetical protein
VGAARSVGEAGAGEDGDVLHEAAALAGAAVTAPLQQRQCGGGAGRADAQGHVRLPWSGTVGPPAAGGSTARTGVGAARGLDRSVRRRARARRTRSSTRVERPLVGRRGRISEARRSDRPLSPL